MSSRAWERRRAKRGLAARQYDAISRAIRRDRAAGKSLPLSYTRRGTGITLTVTFGPMRGGDGG